MMNMIVVYLHDILGCSHGQVTTVLNGSSVHNVINVARGMVGTSVKLCPCILLTS